MNAPISPQPGFLYAPMFPLGPAATEWKTVDAAGLRMASCDGRRVLCIAPETLSELAFQAFRDVSHLLRPGHLAQLRAILDDPEASANDRFVALDLLKNANIAAGGVLAARPGTHFATWRPRHGASLPVGIGVSCSADRQIRAKITPDGVFLEQLETDPAKYLPELTEAELGEDAVVVDLNRPMPEIRRQLSACPVRTRLLLNGTMVVARDIAHARLNHRLERGEALPDYLKAHPIYYAGPVKTPQGYATGSFGPTTAGRMDSYVPDFQAAGGSLVMLAKGNRSRAVRESCKTHGGFYLGSVGGPAARLARDCIRKVEVLEYPELGMEAVWRIETENFPAFVVIDDKGNDFYEGFE